MHRRWYWKFYLLVMALFTVGGFGFSFYYWDEYTSIDHFEELASLPLYVVQLVGLFGFVYWRRIGSPLPWKFVFAATVLELVWVGYSVVTEASPFSDEDTVFLASMGVVGAVISLPLLVALYMYSFRSHALWAKAT